MSIQFDIAKQIIAETCPNRKLKLENIRLFADIIQPKKYQYLQPIITQYFIDNKSEIWLLFLIAHSKR